MPEFATFILATGISGLLTAYVRARAVRKGRLDIPNARSSHTQPTPRGGGVAIVAVCLAALLIAVHLEPKVDGVLLTCGLGGLLVALIGHFDDARGLAALPRLVTHFLGCGVFVFAVLVRAATTATTHVPAVVVILLAVVLVLGMVWSINSFNFMDGIDGIAAAQAVFVSGASAVLAKHVGQEGVWVDLCFATAGASLGFLYWNWAPAKIFMGDVGSGFLGYWLAALALGLHVTDVLTIWTSLTLASVFFADATATLVRRALNREALAQAHRSHAYQILAHRFGKHAYVSAGVLTFNLLVVLPCAYLGTLQPAWAPWIAMALTSLLAFGCIKLGAGSPSK